MDTCLFRCNRYTTGRCELIRDEHFGLTIVDLLSDPQSPPVFNKPIVSILDNCMVKEFVSGEIEVQTSNPNEAPYMATSMDGVPEKIVFDIPNGILQTPENATGIWTYKFKFDLILLGGVNCSYEIIFKRNSPYA